MNLTDSAGHSYPQLLVNHPQSPNNSQLERVHSAERVMAQPVWAFTVRSR